MSTENESHLRKFVTIPEMEIPLSLLFDLISFAGDRQEQIKEQMDILQSALDSEYIERQRKPIDLKNGLRSSIDDARFELAYWNTLRDRLNNISHDILNNQ